MSSDEDDDIEIVLDDETETPPAPGPSNSAPRGGGGKKRTPIWNHFEECLADPKFALCNHCAKKVDIHKFYRGHRLCRLI